MFSHQLQHNGLLENNLSPSFTITFERNDTISKDKVNGVYVKFMGFSQICYILPVSVKKRDVFLTACIIFLCNTQDL